MERLELPKKTHELITGEETRLHGSLDEPIVQEE
jgi:hypothetical protein